MNVTFKAIRRSGDKAYFLSEITGCDERLQVVLEASTDAGVHIPSDTFPYCNIDDTYVLQQILYDGARASASGNLLAPHTKNSAGVRVFVVAVPWLDVRRWELEFSAIDSEGWNVDSCSKSVDVRTTQLMSFAGKRTSPGTGELIEDLDGRYIHDRIHVRLLRAIERGDRVLVSALVEMPFHEESVIDFAFLDCHGNSIELEHCVIEDSLVPARDFKSVQRRLIVLSFEVSRSNPYVCLCAVDTAGAVLSGFSMLGSRTFDALIERFRVRMTSAYDDPAYHDWYIREHRADVPALLEQVSIPLNERPLFSIVCVLADLPAHHVHDLFNSIAQQSYGRWELILVDIGFGPASLESMKDAFDGERVFVVSADPALGDEAGFDAGMAAVEGDFVVLMRASDTLAPDALFEFARAINEHPDCDVLYSDLDTVDVEGRHTHPIFRPAFSPELLRSYNYLRDLLVVRTRVLSDAGEASSRIGGAQGYDLSLHVTEHARRVWHVPRVLLHRRFATEELASAVPSCDEQEAGRRALVEHCRRIGLNAEVLSMPEPGHYRVRHILVDEPHVTIVLLFRGDNPELLESCIRALYAKSSYASFEVVVTHHVRLLGQARVRIEELEQRYDTLSCISWAGPFNWARLANEAADRTRGDYLLYLSEDMRLLTDDALEIMLGYFQSSEVGIVGPKQLYRDGTVEHAGIIVGGREVVTPLFRYMDEGFRGYLDRASVAQNVTAVTGDCMMVRRAVFEEVGGFDEEFPLFYADVDFCLKARDAGFLTVFTPYVHLTHFQGVSRIHPYTKRYRIAERRESALLQASWPRDFEEGDAFYNPNLDPDSSYFALRHGEGA